MVVDEIVQRLMSEGVTAKQSITRRTSVNEEVFELDGSWVFVVRTAV